jgi:hypothetical protein
VSDLLSKVPFQRLSAFAKAKRLSPLMLATLALLANTTVLSALFLLRALLGWGEPAALPTADWRPPAAPLTASAPSAPPAQDVQTLTRPIFAKSRRPTPEKKNETASAAKVAGPPPALALQAIVLANGASRAYLVGRGGASGDWYLVGQVVEEWTISEIRAFELTLKAGERTATLSLYPDTPSPSEAETKPPPPSAAVADSKREDGRRK